MGSAWRTKSICYRGLLSSGESWAVIPSSNNEHFAEPFQNRKRPNYLFHFGGVKPIIHPSCYRPTSTRPTVLVISIACDESQKLIKPSLPLVTCSKILLRTPLHDTSPW